MAAVDLSVSFPHRGVIRLQSRSLFGDAESPTCRRFLGRVFQADRDHGRHDPRREIAPRRSPVPPRPYRRDEVVERIVALLRNGEDGTILARADRHGVARYYPDGALVTGWQITLDQPGRLRLKNRALYRKSGLCQAIERELMSVLGIDQYRTSSFFVHGPGRLRPEAARPSPGDRDPGCGPRRRRAPDPARQAGPAPADLHGLAADRRRGAVRRPGAAARRRGGVRLHVDPHVPRGPQGPRSRRSGSAWTCSTRSWSSAAWGPWRSSPGRCSAGASASAACWSSGPRTTPRSCS